MKSISFVACGTAMLLAGCAGNPLHQLNLMPAPAAYEQVTAPFASSEMTDALAGSGAHHMLYATNRAPVAAGSDGDEDERYYSGERGYLVRVGSADISFGDSDITWEDRKSVV